jgi:hypothetical protein
MKVLQRWRTIVATITYQILPSSSGSLQIPVLKIFSNPVINDIVVPLTIKAQL